MAVIFIPGFAPEWVVLLPSIATIDRSKHFDNLGLHRPQDGCGRHGSDTSRTQPALVCGRRPAIILTEPSDCWRKLVGGCWGYPDETREPTIGQVVIG